jgi:hypothetical protein
VVSGMQQSIKTGTSAGVLCCAVYMAALHAHHRWNSAISGYCQAGVSPLPPAASGVAARCNC